ncbi:MAG: hypothetical protein ABSH39_15315 [Candidatus Acidiferrum sp.]
MPLVTVGASVRRDVNRVQEKSFEHVSPFGKVQMIASAVGTIGTTPAKFHWIPPGCSSGSVFTPG